MNGYYLRFGGKKENTEEQCKQLKQQILSDHEKAEICTKFQISNCELRGQVTLLELLNKQLKDKLKIHGLHQIDEYVKLKEIVEKITKVCDSNQTVEIPYFGVTARVILVEKIKELLAGTKEDCK